MTSKHLYILKLFGATLYLLTFCILFLCDAFVIHDFLPRSVFVSHNISSSIKGLFVSITTTILCIITLCILSKRIFGLYYVKIIPFAINVVTAISFIDMLFAVIIADCMV